MMPQYAMPTAGIGQQVDEAALTAKIRKEIMTEMKEQKLDADRKALDAERREFNKDKNSAIGLVVGYLKPLLDAKISGLKHQPYRNVGVLDSESDVEASRIVAPDEAEVVEDDFTEEEAQRLNDIMALMARFKKVEPEHYLDLLEKMVVMAENGDSTYAMARGVLLK